MADVKGKRYRDISLLSSVSVAEFFNKYPDLADTAKIYVDGRVHIVVYSDVQHFIVKDGQILTENWFNLKELEKISALLFWKKYFLW